MTAGEPALSFLRGGGRLGELIAAFDWSGTALGPIDGWPPHVRTATALMLRSVVPIVMLWGEPGVMIYNDAYSLFAGGRHPRLLGTNVREAWDEVADFNDNVMRVGLAGGTLSYRDQQLTLNRNGRAEPVWMNLDYSPLLDEAGEPAGVMAVVVETTAKVLAERRLSGERERLAQLFEQAPGFMAMLRGPEHRFELVNPSYLRLVGSRALLGRSVAEALPGGGEPGLRALAGRRLRERAGVQRPRRALRRAGRTRCGGRDAPCRLRVPADPRRGRHRQRRLRRRRGRHRPGRRRAAPRSDGAAGRQLSRPRRSGRRRLRGGPAAGRGARREPGGLRHDRPRGRDAARPLRLECAGRRDPRRRAAPARLRLVHREPQGQRVHRHRRRARRPAHRGGGAGARGAQRPLVRQRAGGRAGPAGGGALRQPRRAPRLVRRRPGAGPRGRRAHPHRGRAGARRAGAARERGPPARGQRIARGEGAGAHPRAAGGRGEVPPGAEDGGDRPAHRRHRARLQQPARHHQHQPAGAGQAPGRADRSTAPSATSAWRRSRCGAPPR